MKTLTASLKRASLKGKGSSTKNDAEEKYNPWDHLGEKCDPVPFFDMDEPMGFAYVAPGKRIRPIMEAILFGLKDKNSPLSVLGGPSWRHLVRYIVDISGAENDGSIWSIRDLNPSIVNQFHPSGKSFIHSPHLGQKHFVPELQTWGTSFPKPQGIQINMMPYIIGDMRSIPEEYHGYSKLIHACPVDIDNVGKVGYLTIHESLVPAGESQRRNGLHVEAPGRLTGEMGIETRQKYVRATFGGGSYQNEEKMVGGIFMASSLNETCRVFDRYVEDPNVAVRDDQCSLEHVRHLFGEGHLMAANEIVWMTDKTPHEALPQKEAGPRQFFRLVTSDLTVWFSKRCTPNRLGIVPPPNVVISDYENLDGSRSKLWREYLAAKKHPSGCKAVVLPHGDEGVLWQYYLTAKNIHGKPEGWYGYDGDTTTKGSATYKVEKCHEQYVKAVGSRAKIARTYCRVRSGHYNYKIDFDKMEQTNTQTQETRSIRRYHA